MAANLLLLFVTGVLLLERGVQSSEIVLIFLMCTAPIASLAALIDAGDRGQSR